MKHEKEWCTCDRCGEEIKEDVGAWRWVLDHTVKRMSKDETLELISSSPHGYVSNIVHELPEIYAITIIRGYDRKNRTIHLCGKCRKEFERFMRNGK